MGDINNDILEVGSVHDDWESEERVGLNTISTSPLILNKAATCTVKNKKVSKTLNWSKTSVCV